MPAAAHLAHKAAHHSPMPRWLIHYGALGLFTVALLDASPIPLAIPGSADILLLLLAAHRDSHPVFLALTTIVGSVIGGYLTWGMGKKGGETMVARYAPKRLLEPLTRWVEHRGFLALVAWRRRPRRCCRCCWRRAHWAVRDASTLPPSPWHAAFATASLPGSARPMGGECCGSGTTRLQAGPTSLSGALSA
jgi:hypothetical protein